MPTITSNGTGGGNWSAGATWAGGSAPVDNDTVVIAAGDTVIVDTDMSTGYDNGIAGLTITGHATTPAMLAFKADADGTYWLKIKAGTFVTGTNAAVLGRLMMGGGTWGSPAAPGVGRKHVIELMGIASIVAQYLDGQLYCDEPTNKYVEVYGNTHTCNQATGVNTTTGVITLGAAAPSQGTPVRVKSSGTLPAGLDADTTYFVRSSSGSTCKLAGTNSDNTMFIPTTTGTGTMTLYEGHTNTGTKVMNVVQDVTGDPLWTTAANFNTVTLIGTHTAANDVQLDTMATIAAGAITITAANVDSVQHPLALLFLTSRNVMVVSRTTTANTVLINTQSGSGSWTIRAAVVSVGGSTTAARYGLGFAQGLTPATISGGIFANLSGFSTTPVFTAVRPQVTGACIVGSSVAAQVYWAFNNCMFAGLTNNITGQLWECTDCEFVNFGFAGNSKFVNCKVRQSGYATRNVEGITALNCQFISNGSASVENCPGSLFDGCESRASTVGVSALGLSSKFINGVIHHCNAGVSSQSVVENCEFYSNGYDIAGYYAPRAKDCLMSSAAVGGQYIWGTNGRYPAFPLSGVSENHQQVDGDWAAYCPGGKIEPAGSGLHVLTAQNSLGEVWLCVPFAATAGVECSVEATAQLSTTSNWTELPVFAIVDPDELWRSGSELLDSEQMASNTGSQAISLAHIPVASKELWFVIRAMGGNTSGTGTGTCSFSFTIDPGATGGGPPVTKTYAFAG